MRKYVIDQRLATASETKDRIVSVDVYTPASLENTKSVYQEVVDIATKGVEQSVANEKAFGADRLVPVSDHGVRDMINRCSHIHVLKVAGVVAGILMDDLRCEYSNCYYINNVFIKEEYRNLGYAHKLLKFTVEHHKKLHPILDVSCNNPAASAVYNSLGFVPMKTRMILKGNLE